MNKNDSSSTWIYTTDLAEGIEGLPKLNLQLQNTLRMKRKITFSKIGNRVVYKREWVEEYLNNNTRKAEAI